MSELGLSKEVLLFLKIMLFPFICLTVLEISNIKFCIYRALKFN